MKFYDRKNELDTLHRIASQSRQTATFTLLVGRRRIGKTSLLVKAMENEKYLYLFVSHNSEAVLCSQFQQQTAEALGLQIFGTVNRFRDLFEQLLLFAQNTHYTLIIDEFQEFDNVNRAVFGEIQDLWDRYKDSIKLNFIVCGSANKLNRRR